jgi:cell division septation protein DedD
MDDYPKAREYYRQVIDNDRDQKLLAPAYYRLSKLALKQGRTEEAQEYFTRLKKDFPDSPEANLQDIPDPDIYYSVQVGAFSSRTNAANLAKELNEKGFAAYVQEQAPGEERAVYRVRVGKTVFLKDAKELKERLSSQGYPTKIYP